MFVNNIDVSVDYVMTGFWEMTEEKNTFLNEWMSKN